MHQQSTPHAVGGAISSRARPLASGPIWVTATAAIATITAITTNTAVRPKPCWIHRKDGGLVRITGWLESEVASRLTG